MSTLLWLAIPIAVTAVYSLLSAWKGQDTYPELSARQRALQRLERVYDPTRDTVLLSRPEEAAAP